jgi:hypothetical protein
MAEPEYDPATGQLKEEIENKLAQQRAMKVHELRESMQRWRQAQEAASRTAEEIDEHSERINAAAQEIREQLWDAAIAWLQEKWGDSRPCPYCNTDEWTVGTPLDDVLDSMSERVSAYFPVTCNNCGHTVQINAVMAGVLPSSEELEETP